MGIAKGQSQGHHNEARQGIDDLFPQGNLVALGFLVIDGQVLQIGDQIDDRHALRHHQQHGQNVRAEGRFPGQGRQALHPPPVVIHKGPHHPVEPPGIRGYVFPFLGVAHRYQMALGVEFVNTDTQQPGIRQHLGHVNEALAVLDPQTGTKIRGHHRAHGLEAHFLGHLLGGRCHKFPDQEGHQGKHPGHPKQGPEQIPGGHAGSPKHGDF